MSFYNFFSRIIICIVCLCWL